MRLRTVQWVLLVLITVTGHIAKRTSLTSRPVSSPLCLLLCLTRLLGLVTVVAAVAAAAVVVTVAAAAAAASVVICLCQRVYSQAVGTGKDEAHPSHSRAERLTLSRCCLLLSLSGSKGFPHPDAGVWVCGCACV